jgi:hypothetical protein
MKETYTKEEVLDLLQDCWSDAQFNLALQVRNQEFITFRSWVTKKVKSYDSTRTNS